jgi:hypothetical protein
MKNFMFSVGSLAEDDNPDEKNRKQMEKIISGHIIQRSDYLA